MFLCTAVHSPRSYDIALSCYILHSLPYNKFCGRDRIKDRGADMSFYSWLVKEEAKQKEGEGRWSYQT